MNLTVMQVINSALLLSGSLFCLIAALSFFWGKNYEPRTRWWMIGMQLSTSVLLLSDAIAYFYRGVPGNAGYWMVRISNFLVFLLSDVTLFFFARYVNGTLFREEERKALKRIRYAEGNCFIGMALVVVSQFTNLYYYFDAENFYHRTAVYPLSMLIPVITMLIEASLLLQYRKRISTKLFLAIGSYIVLPLAGAAIQILFYGPALINLMIGISMLLMFLVAISEQNAELRQLASSRAQIEEKLEIATMLNRCVTKLSDGTDRDVALHSLMEAVRDYFQADRCYLFEILPERNTLVNTYEAVANGVEPQIDNLQEVPVAVVDHWMESFRRQQVYYMDDLEQEKGFASYEMLERQAVWRLLAVPICQGKRIIGFMGLDNPRQHAQDATLLSSIQFFILNSLEQRDQQRYLKQLGYYDMLTHLQNRNSYMERLYTWKKEKNEQVGGIYADLNGLKQTNDTQGHEAGDDLICGMAAALESVFPGQAYRIGGDEFVILLRDIPKDSFEAKVQQLREELAQRQVSASIGTVWEQRPADVEAMMREADDQMYQEKEKMKHR